jgi:spore germination cell wall hydrolase CwlJ-like protein
VEFGPLFADVAIGVACVIGEAGGEGPVGMRAVAEVIRNRARTHYQSDGTIAGTVFKPWQFSCFGDGTSWRGRLFKLNWQEPTVQQAKQAWDTAFNDDGTGRRSDLVKGAVLYHTIEAPVIKGKQVPWPPKWAIAPSVVEVARIGGHVFYTDEKR